MDPAAKAKILAGYYKFASDERASADKFEKMRKKCWSQYYKYQKKIKELEDEMGIDTSDLVAEDFNYPPTPTLKRQQTIEPTAPKKKRLIEIDC